MHVHPILNKLLNSTIHKSRIKSLIPVIETIIKIKQLTLTKIARNLDLPGQERAGIRRVDRLLANIFYQDNAIKFYKCVTEFVVGNKKRPTIIIDWTGLPNSKRKTKNGEQCVLRSSLAAEGRAITLYEEVHPKRKEGCPKIHDAFLNNLKSLLPADCRPIIVTDAGFKNPWFRALRALNWDYIGRVRGAVHFNDGTGSKGIKTLFEKATSIPKSLGQMLLAKNNSILTYFFIYTHKLKGRKKLTRTGKIDNTKDSKMIARGYREPWILVSSLSKLSAKKIVKIYKIRMTIEEGIRDTKSRTTGFSMNDNLTIQSKRYTVWLLLSALASLIAWMVGHTAEKLNLHYAFQANTYRNVRVLSFFYLGCQIIRKKIAIPIDFNIIHEGIWERHYD